MMASSSHGSPTTTTTITTTTSTRASLPSRNPVPLSASQESQVRDLYYKNVRTKCADEIKEFASCAVNRTVSATWACRQQRLSMNSCMIKHATQRMQDEAREEWFATMELRRQEKEAVRRNNEEAEAFNREWWKKVD